MTNKKKIVIGLIIVFVVFCVIGSIAAGGDSEPVEQQGNVETAEKQEDSQTKQEQQDPNASESYKLEFGELLEENNNYGVVVLKAKITPSATNKTTIDQNYYNVEDYIQSHDMDGISELQYWAVADMSNGKEEKVISFTVPSSLIESISSKEIPANQLGDKVSELWILPSLR